MNQPQCVHDMVQAIKRTSLLPVCVKMRVFDEVSKSIEFAKCCVDAGADFLVVHGRTSYEEPHAVCDSTRDH